MPAHSRMGAGARTSSPGETRSSSPLTPLPLHGPQSGMQSVWLASSRHRWSSSTSGGAPPPRSASRTTSAGSTPRWRSGTMLWTPRSLPRSERVLPPAANSFTEIQHGGWQNSRGSAGHDSSYSGHGVACLAGASRAPFSAAPIAPSSSLGAPVPPQPDRARRRRDGGRATLMDGYRVAAESALARSARRSATPRTTSLRSRSAFGTSGPSTRSASQWQRGSSMTGRARYTATTRVTCATRSSRRCRPWTPRGRRQAPSRRTRRDLPHRTTAESDQRRGRSSGNVCAVWCFEGLSGDRIRW
jgi:hypothetical protein